MLSLILFQTLNTIFNIVFWLIVARAILSWFRPAGYNKLYVDISRVLFVLTEPILAPIRNRLPTGSMGIDLSPLIALFALEILKRLLLSAIVVL